MGGVFTHSQLLIVTILLATIATFLWGRWRHDLVAFGSLLACVLVGLLPSTEAFAGFAHPAVITVACVLVLSAGLQNSGAIDLVARRILPTAGGPTVMIAALIMLGAVLSAFMNNVGALALLMPVAVRIAQRNGLPPGKVLMPLSFGSILGGMTTLIGTPPNLVVAGFRAEASGAGFAMFDFAPVGIVVALLGVTFVALLGWRVVPARHRAGTESFETGEYLTEARVPDSGKAVGMLLRDLEEVLEEADAQVIGIVRGELQIPAPSPFREIRAGDILLIQAEPEALASVLSSLNLTLEEAVAEPSPAQEGAELQQAEHAEQDKAANTRPDKALRSRDIVLMELVVLPNSDLAGHSATDILLRSRFGINLLAISRRGRRSTDRLRTTVIRTGDVLLMQGSRAALTDFAAQFACVPLAERPLRIPDKRRAIIAMGILVAAVSSAAISLLPAVIAFAAGVFIAAVSGVVSVRVLYRFVDWPVIVLLGALIPVAGAMESTGAADVIAALLLDGLASGNAVIALAIILIVSMTLSDFMNNAATAAVMCPIAIGTANSLGVSSDPFLMSVAIGASCAFLTPIGHQNNALILGPSGLRFGDYWRLGLPLEVIVVAVGVPMILLVWPLSG
jgi:di/tricarboxylate transporter